MYNNIGRKRCDCINFESEKSVANRDHGIFIPGIGACIKNLTNVEHFNIYLTRGCSICNFLLGIWFFALEKYTKGNMNARSYLK